MAIFRKIHVTFWDDPFVETLTPEEKYFYLFLMTNPKVTECGIYELTKKKMRDWTGYNEETVEKLLKRFIDYKKVAYNEETKEIALINKPKFINILGKPVIDCIKAELNQVKDKSLIHLLSKNCQNIQIRNIYDMYTDPSTIRDTKRGQEEEEEKEEEQEEARLLWINIFTQNPGQVELDFVKELIQKFEYDKTKKILYDLRENNFHSIRKMKDSLNDDGTIKPLNPSFAITNKVSSQSAAHEYIM